MFTLLAAAAAGGVSPATGMQSFQWLGALILRGEVVWAFSGGIVIAAMIYLIRLRYRIRPLLKALDRAGDLVATYPTEREFAENYERITRVMTVDPVLGSRWTELEETLLFPEDPDGEQVIQNTHESSYYFSRVALLEERVAHRLANAFPNLLTGFGIFGTFLGLAAAVFVAAKGINPQTGEVDVGVVANLLSGASLAFWSSVAGIGSSLVFSFVYRVWDDRLTKSIAALNQALDSVLRRTTPERLIAKTLHEATEQTTLLRTFSTDLAVSLTREFDLRLTPAFEKLANTVESLENAAMKVNQETMEAMVQQFEKVLSEGTRAETQRMASTMRDLQGLMEKNLESSRDIQEEIITANRTAMAEMHQELRDQGAGVIADMRAGAEQAAEAHRSILDANREAIDGIRSGLEEESRRILAVMQESAAKVAEEVADLLGSIEGRYRDLLDEMDKTLGEHLGKLDRLFGSLEGTVQRSDALADKVSESLVGADEIVSELSGVRDGLRETAELMKSSAEALDPSVARLEGFGESVRGATASIEDYMKQVSQSESAMRGIWEEYAQRFRGADESLAKLLAEWDTALATALARASEFNRDLDTYFSEATSALRTAIEELGTKLDDGVAGIEELESSIRKLNRDGEE